MTDGAPTSSTAPPAPDGRSNRIWLIAFAIVVLLLLGAILLVLLRDDDSEDTSTSGTLASTTTSLETEAQAPGAGTESTSTSPAAAPAPGTSGPECSAAALLASIDSGITADGSEVAEFECTTDSSYVAGAYAWARIVAPDVDPLVVFFTAYEGDAPDGGPSLVDWRVLAYGSDVACEDELPVEACDVLPGAPRR